MFLSASGTRGCIPYWTSTDKRKGRPCRHVTCWISARVCVCLGLCQSFFFKDDTLAALTGPAEAQSSLISNAYERTSSAVRNSEEGRFSCLGEPSVIIWLSAESLSEQQFILRIHARSPSLILPTSNVPATHICLFGGPLTPEHS